jgi:acyl dehydratase
MTLSSAVTTKLSRIPNIKYLLLKAALKQSSYDPQRSPHVYLPNNKFCFEGLVLNERNVRLFHQVVGWDLASDSIHCCYLHSLAFPMHIMLFLLPEFPFPLLGLVHVNNQISQRRPIKKGEKLSVSSCFEQLELHPKGWLFSIKVEFYSASKLVWQSISTNLFRTEHGHVVDPKAKYSTDTFTDTNAINTNWQLSASLGRRYAKVSGDFNPIHLSKWSAKLFGFKQHIIHGMWTKSNCISSLQKITPSVFLQAFEINTTFKQPLYLPCQVKMAVKPFELGSVNNEQHFKVVGIGVNDEPQSLHLIGNIRSI